MRHTLAKGTITSHGSAPLDPRTHLVLERESEGGVRGGAAAGHLDELRTVREGLQRRVGIVLPRIILLPGVLGIGAINGDAGVVMPRRVGPHGGLDP
jgi:hypothetical protein